MKEIYDLYSEDAANEPKREYLGASVVCKKCERQNWYNFRQAYDKPFIGRMLRLFDTGKREELRIVNDLRRTGKYEVDNKTPEGKQHGFSAFGGHYAGSGDGKIREVGQEEWMLLEVKTHNQKSYDYLIKNKLKKAKPEHYDQMQIYMNEMDLAQGFYVAVNKNTDEIYKEIIDREEKKGKAYREKALRIITSEDAPNKISQTWDGCFDCTYCSYNRECHKLTGYSLPVKSCRTCVNSTPLPDGGWECELKSKKIEDEVMPVGCEEHFFIPKLVPATLTVANPSVISYIDGDGKVLLNLKGEGFK